MRLRLLCFFGSAIIGFAPALALCGTGALPDLPQSIKPSPEPTAPSDWDYFAPPVSGTGASLNSPTVAEWTRTGGPDETLILTGDKLSNFAAPDEGKDTQFIFYGQTTASDGIQAEGLIQRLDGMKSAVTLPSSLPPWSIYFLWPRNSAGIGFPVAVNRTDAWWLNPDDQVTRGETVSIFGRNLSHQGGTTSAWVYVKPAGITAAGEWAAVTAVNPYRVDFVVPPALVNGNYEVWLHNGHGASYGWSGPLSLVVTNPRQWNGATFNVKAYGATGDGVTDDTAAIQNASAAAIAYRDRSGSPATLCPTVFFPAGIYMMHAGISLKHDLRYTGAGSTVTILRCNADFQHTANQGLIYGERTTEQNIELSNLTLDGNNRFAETTFPYDYLLNCATIQQWKDICLSNLIINIANPGNRVNAVTFGDVGRLTITDCEIVGGNIMLMNASRVAISHCSFPFVNDLFTAIYCQSVDGVSITHCMCADQDITSDTGQGLGRFLILGGYLGSQRNFYVADNETTKCGPRVGVHDQNTGEQILSEGNVVRYEGNPTAATSNTATFADLTADPNLRRSQTAVVVKGKGLGQTRMITDINYGSKTITVNPTWNVLPDSTSVVQIAWTTDRCVIYRNTLNGKDDYGTRLTASCGIEPYGGCNEWIADSNDITGMRNGIYFAGLAQYSTEPVTTNEPCFFHYYANNQIKQCYRGIFYFAEIPMNDNGTPLVSGTHIALIGNTFRKNLWSDFTAGGICFDGSISGCPVDMTLFEHNTFTNLSQGINFRSEGHASEATNAILYKNTFARGTARIEGSFATYFLTSTSAPALRENTWTGFPVIHTGSPPGAIIELPKRTFDLQTAVGASATFTTAEILNAGTARLDWTASTDASWLTISPASGTVLNESSAYSLTLSCDPSGLPPGSYTGSVTISAGIKTLKFLVPFTVNPTATPPSRIRVIISKVIAPNQAP